MRVILLVAVSLLVAIAGAVAFELLVEAADARSERDGEPDLPPA